METEIDEEILEEEEQMSHEEMVAMILIETKDDWKRWLV